MLFKSLKHPHQLRRGEPGCYLFQLRTPRDNPAKNFKKMRDLVFKNLISSDRSKRMISSCETVDKQGMRTIIRRHFVCKVIDIDDHFLEKPLPQIFIRRICKPIRQQKSLFCRMKGSLYASSKGRLFLILFGHSFRIDLRPKSQV